MASNFNINKITLDNNSESAEILIGNASPIGLVDADPGSLFIVSAGVSSQLYINTSTSPGPGSTWTLFSVFGAGGDHATLSSLAWNLSGHIGTAAAASSRGSIAVFDDSGATAEIVGDTGEILYHDGTNWVVLAAGSAGQVLQSNGAAAPSWVAASGGTVTDLQTAYDGGNTIVTASATDIGFTLSATGGGFTVNGDGAVDFGGTTEISSFIVGSEGLMTLQSRDTTLIQMQANNVANKTLTISASNAGTGEGQISITSDSQVDITDGIGTLTLDGGALSEAGMTSVSLSPSGAVDLVAGAASQFTTSAGVLTLDGAGGVTIEGNAGAVDVNSGAGTWDASTLSLTSTGLLDINAGANMDVNVTGTFDLLSTSTFSIDGTGTSNVTADAGDLTLSTTTSGEVLVDGIGGVEINSSAGAIDIGNDAVSQPINIGAGAAARTITIGNATGATALNIDSGTGGTTIDSSGSVSVDAVGASNVTTDSGALTLNTTTSGTVDVNGADGVNIAGNAGEVDITTTGLVDINGGTVEIESSTSSVSISSTTTTDVQATGSVTVDSSGGDIGVGTDSNNGAINIGTGTTAGRSITLGNTTGTTSLALEAGTGGVTIDSPNTTITGNLLVQGTTTTVESEIVNVKDNFLYLNDGYTTTSALEGGFVVNSLPTATSDTVNGSFTAGIAPTNNPTVITSGSGTFAAGDFIQVSGAADQQNDGLYEVVSHTGTTLTIAGIGATGTTYSFFQNDFVTDSTPQGTITKVTVGVTQVDTSGNLQYGYGADTGTFTFDDLATSTGITLQTAYVAGNTITTSAAEGSVVISGDQTLQITTSGGLDVDTVADFDVTTFDVQMTGTNGFSIDGTDASNVTTSSGDLTLSATANSVVIDGGEAAADAVTITASNAAGGIDVNAGTGGITIDAAAASSFTTSAGALTLDGAGGVTIEGNAGAVDVNSGVGTWDASSLALTTTGLLDLNAGANMDVDVTGTFDLLSTSTFSIDGTGSSNITATSGDLLVSTDVAGAVVVTSAANVDINAATSITVDAATGISIDAGAASNFTTSAGAITVDGAGGLNLQGNASEIDITTSGPIDINSGAATWDATTLSLDATDDTNLTMTANDGVAHTLTIAASNAGAGTASINISADEDFTVDSSILSLDATDNTNLSMAANDGGTKTLRIDASNSGAGTALIDINADEDITIDSTAGAVSIDSSAASNFTTSSGDLTLSATANSVIVDGAEAAADAVRINASNAAGGIDIDAGTAGIDISTTGALSANATGQITIGGTNTAAAEVQVNGAANSEIITLTQTSGESFGVFAGTTDPSGSVTADAGSLFVRDTGFGAELYQNTSTGSGTTWTQFTSGSTSVPTGNTIWVDSVNGNDSTGAADDLGRPFLTIAAAIAASSTGDTIQLLPGNYPEDGLDLTGLSLIGLGGWEHTVVGPAPASATDDVIILGDGGYVEGISLNVPATSGTPSSSVPAPPGGTRGFVAILCNQATGTNSIYNIAMYGDGATPLTSAGSGIYRSGGGKTIGQNIRVEGGGIVDCMKVDQGVLALEGIHVPQSTGAITNVLYVTGRGGPPFTAVGRAQMVGFNSGNSNVTNAIRIDSGVSVSIRPTAIVFTPNIFNANTALSSGGDYVSIALLGGRLENVTTAVSVDLTANGDDAVYRISANHQPEYIYNPQVAANSDFSLNFAQEATDELESSFNIFGSQQLSVGFVERGVASALGRGRPFISGMTVITSDSTATSTTEGGNLTDVTAAARSKVGSLVSFQGTAANHTILWGSQRKDAANNPLKFWGVEAVVDTAGGLGGSYVFEIWDGTNWVEVTSQATSFVEGYSYGKTFFGRSSSDEIFRFGLDRTETFRPSSTNPFGVDRSSTWTAKTISGINAYWVRARIVTAPATSPQFESFKLIESAFNVSADGVPSQTGLSKLRSNVPLAGRVWSGAIAGMGSTLSNGTVTIGNTAGVTFVQQFNESEATSAGNTYSVQFSVPLGICTAFPIKVSVAARIDTGGAATTPVTAPIALRVAALPQRLSGVLVADPAGGLTPVKRDYADADLLSAAGSRDPYDDVFNIEPEGAVAAGATWADLENQVHLIDLAEIDVENLYSEDVVILQFGINTLGPLQSFIPFALVLEGVTYQAGKPLG